MYWKRALCGAGAGRFVFHSTLLGGQETGIGLLRGYSPASLRTAVRVVADTRKRSLSRWSSNGSTAGIRPIRADADVHHGMVTSFKFVHHGITGNNLIIVAFFIPPRTGPVSHGHHFGFDHDGGGWGHGRSFLQADRICKREGVRLRGIRSRRPRDGRAVDTS